MILLVVQLLINKQYEPNIKPSSDKTLSKVGKDFHNSYLLDYATLNYLRSMHLFRQEAHTVCRYTCASTAQTVASLARQRIPSPLPLCTIAKVSFTTVKAVGWHVRLHCSACPHTTEDTLHVEWDLAKNLHVPLNIKLW